MVSDNPNLEIPKHPPDGGSDEREMVSLASFCIGLSATRRFVFDGNERAALRRAGELLLRHAEKKR